MPAAPDAGLVSADVARALAEDIGSGDLTAGLIRANKQLATRVITREEAILAGSAWFDETFSQLEGEARVQWHCQDGDTIEPGQEVCRLEGDARNILSGERTALNFLQTLSATATQTRAYVDAIKGTGSRILDTRKTIPGLRLAQKYAVLCGGGNNHRTGLFDAVLLKENHISAAGSITAALETARHRHPGMLLEVEVEDLDQLSEACEAGARRALLDNFSLDKLREAVALFSGTIELEASGGIEQVNIRKVAQTGVNYISIGAVTKHVRAIDFSMRFVEES